MQPNPRIKTSAPPNGARFFRCALQVNPHHYAGTFRGKPNPDDSRTYVQGILDRCVTKKIEVIAVTDHNSVQDVDLFREEAGKRSIVVFPGFELSSSENVHVLCIFEPASDTQALDRNLGLCGLAHGSPPSTLSTLSFAAILEKVADLGGVTIAAHVTSQNGGLLTTLHGQSRVNAWRDPNLRAIQIPGAIDDADQATRPILRNSDPNYKRASPAATDLAVAVVNAKDVKEAADIDDDASSCWIKMSEVSVSGLQQAFFDPQSRIRVAGDAEPEPHAELVAISWEGGFFEDGLELQFNENLNVLVGGRGTGKSTVIESLRYALALDPLGDDAKQQHEGVVRNVLKAGTKIALQVRTNRPTARSYRIERTVPNPPVVRDDGGVLLNVRPIDVLPGIEVYGQHEISELTRSPEKLTKLLDRFGERDASLPQRKSALRRQLEKSRARMKEVRTDIRQTDERLAALPALQERLRQYQVAGVEERLSQQSLLLREERVFTTVTDRLSPLRDAIENLAQAARIDVAFLSDAALDALPNKDLLQELEGPVERLGTDLADATAKLQTALSSADAAISVVRGRWAERRQAVDADLTRILRELQRERIDGHELLAVRKQVEELQPQSERRADLKRGLDALVEQRRTLVTEWEEACRQEFRRLSGAARKIGRRLDGRVRVEVTYAGDRKPLTDLLQQSVGGRLREAMDAINASQNLSMTELANCWRGGADALVERYQLPRAQAERLAQSGDDVAMQIEELDLTPTTRIELNVAPEGQTPEWHDLPSLSTGQKATAVLLLLLLESDAPVVIDQPEDDLDNRFITEGIVPRMREEKRRRQFVFATHNANVPVLGDAELIVGLSTVTDGGRTYGTIRPADVGSIDKPTVKGLVEEVLEGGREAFERRRLKYGF